MNGAGLVIGSAVTIAAIDDYYAFIDGWRGTITNTLNGLFVVVCEREDGPKTFLIPPDQLRKA